MYTSIYIYVYKYTYKRIPLCMYTHTCTYDMHTTCVYLHVCTYIYIYTDIDIKHICRKGVYKYTHICICVCGCGCADLSLCAFAQDVASVVLNARAGLNTGARVAAAKAAANQGPTKRPAASDSGRLKVFRSFAEKAHKRPTAKSKGALKRPAANAQDVSSTCRRCMLLLLLLCLRALNYVILGTRARSAHMRAYLCVIACVHAS